MLTNAGVGRKYTRKWWDDNTYWHLTKLIPTRNDVTVSFLLGLFAIWLTIVLRYYNGQSDEAKPGEFLPIGAKPIIEYEKLVSYSMKQERRRFSAVKV